MKKQQRKFQNEFITKGTIGSGTFGTVKKCIWKKTDQLCAVKCIDNVNSMNIELIQEEAYIMENAQSDYSLKLYDHFYDKENSQYVFVMPYCKFGSVEKKLNDDWTLDNLLLFLYQITQGFVDFSQKQITHLDLKPQNILLKGPGQYLVCDFGCSKVIRDLAISKNFLRLSYSKGLGTPQYAAPQIEMNSQANKYSDVWSLGVILYKMIYHKTPFNKRNNNMLAFGAYKTTFQGHNAQLQPVVSLLKGMLSLQKRPSWKQIRNRIYCMLKIDDQQVQIITSTGQYIQYVNNLSVLGTCFIHHVDRIKGQLQISGIQCRQLQKVLLYFLLKLTQKQLNSDMFYFFPFTWKRVKNAEKLKVQQIHQQIYDLLIERSLISQKLQTLPLSQLKLMLVKETKRFAQKIIKMPQQLRMKIQKTPKYEFFKVKKIIQFMCSENGSNMNYRKSGYLSQLVKYLIYS